MISRQLLPLNYLKAEQPQRDATNGGSSSEITVIAIDYHRRSVISRMAYNYDEKYLLEGQLRADGSSIFARDTNGDISLQFLPVIVFQKKIGLPIALNSSTI